MLPCFGTFPRLCLRLFAIARLEVAALPVRFEHGHGDHREAPTLLDVAVALRFGRQARASDAHHGASAALYHAACVLVTQNSGVPYGLTNGTRGTFAG